MKGREVHSHRQTHATFNLETESERERNFARKREETRMEEIGDLGHALK